MGFALLARYSTRQGNMCSPLTMTQQKEVPLTTDDKRHYGKLPDGWAVCQLSECWQLLSGRDLTPSEYSDEPIGVPYITGASNFEKGDLIINRWTLAPKVIAKKGDLLVTCKGTVGEMLICQQNECHIARQIMAIRNIYGFNVSFLRYTLIFHILKITEAARGIIPGISREDLLELELSIPPLAEQHRIVTAIESAFAVIDEIEQNKADLQSAVTAAKSKILSLAISGKLVPQDPNDEPANVLLERIKSEREKLTKSDKIKRGKADSATVNNCDTLHYGKLPDSWAVCQLGEVSEIARGGSPRPIQDYITNDIYGVNWIKIGDTAQGSKYITRVQEKITSDGVARSRFVKAGDFLLTNSMSFGRPYILKVDGCIHDGWLVIRDVKKAFHPDFLYYLLSSDWAFQSLSQVAYGSTVKNLKSDTVKSFSVPLPPHAEQKRIVSAIESAFKQLDAIANILK